MLIQLNRTVLVCLGCLGVAAAEQAVLATAPEPVSLTVSSGVPLRLYITERLPMRKDQPIRAKLIEPIWAFDRIVLPEGAEVAGHVTSFRPVPKMVRTRAILGGDFTPLHRALVEFTSVTLPDGRSVPLKTEDSTGLLSMYSPRLAQRKKQQNSSPSNAPRNTGVLGTAKQTIKTQIDARRDSLLDVVRGPNKRERLEDFLVMKLPYHPQWYRRGTRFDAVLLDPLGFGNVLPDTAKLRSVGLQPPMDSIAMVRLLTGLSSANAKPGALVEGVLSQPLFEAGGQLLLPEGTRLTGSVKKALAARWFRRGGQLRFTFNKVESPAGFHLAARDVPTPEAQLSGVEADPKASIKVDEEGTAKATESKARFLGPLLSLAVASRAADDDSDRVRTSGSGPNSNRGGRILGGLSGFGLAGSAIAQSSKTAGKVLGYYGLAWSVYSAIISRGREVEFEKNTAMAVRFGSRTPEAPKMKNSPVAQPAPDAP